MGSKDLDTKRKQESSGMPSLVEFWSGQTNQSDWLNIWVKKHHRTSNNNTNILFIWSDGFKTNLLFRYSIDRIRYYGQAMEIGVRLL